MEAFVDGSTFLHPSPGPSPTKSPSRRNGGACNPWSPMEGPPNGANGYPINHNSNMPDHPSLLFPVAENNMNIGGGGGGGSGIGNDVNEEGEEANEITRMTDREAMLPRLVTHESLPDVYDPMGNHGTG